MLEILGGIQWIAVEKVGQEIILSYIYLNKMVISSEECREQIVRGILKNFKKLYPVIHVRAYAKEEVYSEPTDDMPDIVLLGERDVDVRHVIPPRFEILMRYDEKFPPLMSLMCSGDHSLYGTLIMHGPDIPLKGWIDGAKIIDITPTVLKIFGLNIPEYMDGKPLI